MLAVLDEIERAGCQAEYQREQAICDDERAYWDGRVAACRDLRRTVETLTLSTTPRSGAVNLPAAAALAAGSTSEHGR